MWIIPSLMILSVAFLGTQSAEDYAITVAYQYPQTRCLVMADRLPNGDLVATVRYNVTVSQEIADNNNNNNSSSFCSNIDNNSSSVVIVEVESVAALLHNNDKKVTEDEAFS